MRRYTSAEHRFFDELVTFLSSLCGLAVGLSAQHQGVANAFLQGQNVIIQGRSNVSGLEFVFYPYSLMQAIVNNDWPTVVELHEQPLISAAVRMPIHLTGLKRLHASLIESTFVHYFESVRPDVEASHSENIESWPAVWNFGRIVRNAIVHRGIYFKNPSASAVTWRTLTYSPADNGRQIIYRDLGPVEIILLMEDMDAAV